MSEHDTRVSAAVGPDWLEHAYRRFSTTAAPRPMPKVTGRWMFLTPELAAYLLEHHHDPAKQRHLTDARVLKYAEEMRAGLWDERTPQFIAFDVDGINADGQHRLEAIVKTGLGQWFIVAWGVPHRAKLNIDTHKPRTAVNNLALSDGRDLFHGVADTEIQAFMRAFLQGGVTSKVELTAGALREALEQYAEAVKFVRETWFTHESKRGLRRASVAAVIGRGFHAQPHVAGRIAEFAHVLISGMMRDPMADAAVIPYRDHLMKTMGKRNSNANADVYLRGAAALLAFIRREPRVISRAVWTDPFPLSIAAADDAPKLQMVG